MIDDSLLKYIYDAWCLNGIPYTGVSTSYENVWHYKNGVLHREDGPAVIYQDGSKFWFINDKQHREDGPASEWANGTIEWHIHGRYITTWKEYHELSTLSPQEQMIVKLKYGEQLS